MAIKKPITQSSVADQSTEDLLLFAKENCSLEFEEGAGRNYIIAQIAEAMSWAYIRPEENATHVRLKVLRSPDANGDRGARVGFNGDMITIEREKEVVVSIGHYNVMVDCNARGFVLSTEISADSPTSKRIPKSMYPLQVVEFINKGEKKKKAK
jgi:hypothetical protein|tara:strand:+ start:248 stop:709 length:462 start_codon:yes stop_codon:yes gene_type:complete